MLIDRRALFIGAATMLGIAHCGKSDEMDRFVRFARQELGNLVAGVGIDTVKDIEKVFYTHRETRRLLAIDFRTDGPLSYAGQRERAEEIARLRDLDEAEIVSWSYAYGAAYDGEARRILLKRGATTAAAGQELWHAAADIDYGSLGQPRRDRVRRLDEALSIALGDVALVAAFHGDTSPRSHAEEARVRLAAEAAKHRNRPVTGERYALRDEERAIAVRLTVAAGSLHDRFSAAKRYLETYR